MSRDPLTAPPTDDADVAAWTAALGLDGLIDRMCSVQYSLPTPGWSRYWRAGPVGGRGGPRSAQG